MDKLQLDKNAKLTGRVYFKDEVMWLGLSGAVRHSHLTAQSLF